MFVSTETPTAELLAAWTGEDDHLNATIRSELTARGYVYDAESDDWAGPVPAPVSDELIAEALAELDEPAKPAVLTESEALAILGAMNAYKAMAERLSSVAYNAPDTSTARNLGRLIGLLDAAGDQSFDVLNCASSYGHCSNAQRAIAFTLGR